MDHDTSNRHGADAVDFVVVDVFAERPLAGNPLTLVPDADWVSEERMRAIAREFNQSETTFLVRPTARQASWRLRSLTPGGVEVGGAGHNALGAWLWLAETGRVGTGEHVQQIGAQLLDVVVGRDASGPIRVTMTQSAPVFGTILDDEWADRIVAALGLRIHDLDRSLSAQVVSTGAAHLLVPLRDRGAVDRVHVDPQALLTVLGAADGEGCYVYATEGDDADAYTRFFNPTVGIAEDPATGTAAGPLAAALVRAGRVPEGSTVRILQGNALGRPSHLLIDVAGDVVRLTGSGLVVGHGRLRV